MRPRHRLMACPLVVSLTLLAASPLAAQPKDAAVHAEQGRAAEPDAQAKKEASAHFRRGVELFQVGAYRAALVAFETAHATAPDYRLLYNIGQTKLKLEDYVGAIESYEHYLSQGGPEVPPARREDVETQLVAIRKRVGRIAITTDEAGAQVLVDDVPVGVAPMSKTIAVNGGRHRVDVKAREGATATEVIEVAGGELKEVTLQPTRQGIAAASWAAAMKRWSPMQRRAIGAFTGGGAAAIGAIVWGVLAARKTDDLEEAKKQAGVSPSTVEALRSSAKAYAITSNVLSALTIAAGVTGVVLWFREGDEGTTGSVDAKPGGERSRVRWGLGPGTVSARAHFR